MSATDYGVPMTKERRDERTQLQSVYWKRLTSKWFHDVHDERRWERGNGY